MRTESGAWHDLFLCVTDHDVSLYTSPPTSSEDLSFPSATFPLLACKFREGTRKPIPTDPLDSREVSDGMFTLRIPYTQYYLSAGSEDMLQRWKHVFSSRTDNAVRKMGSITYSAQYTGDVSLTLNWQTGIWLNHDVKGDKSLIFHHPFSSLSSARAKNRRTLSLGFSSSLMDIQIENAELVKFVLTNFLSCHTHTKQNIKSVSVA
eukprot:m.52601 g.52601  ORF g.52601 m.52601 type:complete len:206 (-) comp11002_c0_seq3:120-737(-)